MDAESDALRVAHVPINITVLDVNDNAPMFVNLPYYAIVSIDAKKDDLVTKVKCGSDETVSAPPPPRICICCLTAVRDRVP